MSSRYETVRAFGLLGMMIAVELASGENELERVVAAMVIEFISMISQTGEPGG